MRGTYKNSFLKIENNYGYNEIKNSMAFLNIRFYKVLLFLKQSEKL